MFLPTKAHTKEIVDDQYKIRLGNRVPKDAVNLAYHHVPPINSMENVLITDLSNTILENTRNAESEDVYMYPDHSLLLHTDDGRVELPTEDVLITNVFKHGVPLYYSYQLTYRHYDNKGPDPYGIYHREGITIIDRFGNTIDRPYQVQLIPDTNQVNLYYVIVYTSFNDKESDEYRVVYNAVDVHENGRIETIAGYREPLTLQRAFQRVQDSSEIIALIQKKEIFPVYYQANGEQTSYSKIYVPTPQIEDTRTYEKFRYQLGVELTTPKDRLVFTTPWYSDEVINTNYLNPDEKEGYINGFKRITDRSIESIMRGFIPYKYFEDEKIIRKYFVNIDNPRVQESMRIDGSSELFVNTQAEYPNNDLFIPKHARLIKTPVDKTGTLKFKARPLHAHPHEVLYLSFIIDNSESMGVNDPEKVLRYKMMESIIYSARQFYNQNLVNGYLFNAHPHVIRTEFEVGDNDIIELYSNTMIDSDVTRPIPALTESLTSIKDTPDTFLKYEGTFEQEEWYNRKVMVLITDGEFGDMAELEQKIIEASTHNVSLNVITYHNYDIIRTICEAHSVLCLDATSPRLAMELRYFFFQLAGMSEFISVAPDQDFTMSPDDNDMSLLFVNKTTFPIPTSIAGQEERYGFEIEFDPYGLLPELSIYIKDVVTDEVQATINGSYIITTEMLERDRKFQVYAHSEAYHYSFAPTYALKFNDRRKIQLLMPREKDVKDSWYIRVRNGRFDRKYMDRTGQPIYHYSIPEYYRQSFLEDKGHPYRKIHREKPQVLNNNQMRVRHTPLYIEYDGEEATNINVTINGKRIRVKEWHAFSGIIEVDGAITVNDEVYIDYEYEEDSYIYRGYYDRDTDRFWYLDLNPSEGHYITIRDKSDGEIKDVESFTLIDKTIYMYMYPSSKVTKNPDGSPRPATEIKQYTLFHSFEKVVEKNAILIGEVRVRPNSNQWNISLTDTRTRGGGLKKEITHEIMREFEEESFYYWDIGHWDGQPYPENGVIAVRITRGILREYGGRFTKAEVEEKLNKYLGYGVLPIIEYMDDPDSLLQIPEDLVVEVIDIDEKGELVIKKPTFAVSLEGK